MANPLEELGCFFFCAGSDKVDDGLVAGDFILKSVVLAPQFADSGLSHSKLIYAVRLSFRTGRTWFKSVAVTLSYLNE